MGSHKSVILGSTPSSGGSGPSSTQLPSSLGQKTSAGSLSTVLASDATLPLPTGAATAAKQPALGTAGSASTDVITVQGIASGVAQPISGTVTANIGTAGTLALDATLTGGTAQSKITDGTNIAKVQGASTAPVAADKALTVAISPNKGVPAFTDNATYIVNGNMGGDITGPDITILPEGKLVGYFTWPSTSTPIGRILLQLRAPDGTTYDEVPGSAAAFLSQPTAGAAGTSFALFEGLIPGSVVRFKYVRTSGGTTNSLQGQTRVS